MGAMHCLVSRAHERAARASRAPVHQKSTPSKEHSTSLQVHKVVVALHSSKWKELHHIVHQGFPTHDHPSHHLFRTLLDLRRDGARQHRSHPPGCGCSPIPTLPLFLLSPSTLTLFLLKTRRHTVII